VHRARRPGARAGTGAQRLSAASACLAALVGALNPEYVIRMMASLFEKLGVQNMDWRTDPTNPFGAYHS